jgi:hypothetical protein
MSLLASPTHILQQQNGSPKGMNLRRMHSTLIAQAYRFLVNYPSKISKLQKIYQIRDLTQHTKWCNFSLVPEFKQLFTDVLFPEFGEGINNKSRLPTPLHIYQKTPEPIDLGLLKET